MRTNLVLTHFNGDPRGQRGVPQRFPSTRTSFCGNPNDAFVPLEWYPCPVCSHVLVLFAGRVLTTAALVSGLTHMPSELQERMETWLMAWDRDAKAHLDSLLKLQRSVVSLLHVCRTLSCRPGPPTNGPDLSAQTRTILIVWRADGAQGRFDLFRAADARLKTASLFTLDICPSQMFSPAAEGPGTSFTYYVEMVPSVLQNKEFDWIFPSCGDRKEPESDHRWWQKRAANKMFHKVNDAHRSVGVDPFVQSQNQSMASIFRVTRIRSEWMNYMNQYE